MCAIMTSFLDYIHQPASGVFLGVVSVVLMILDVKIKFQV